jgi:stage IV sporulation protein FB
MASSLKLFSIRGIDLRLHITFPLILLWAAFQFGFQDGALQLEGALFGVIAISLLFVLVTLHELGHSFAAQYFGVPVKRIILSPLGGMAQLSQIPEKPIQELIIASAGPAVNVIIAVLMGFSVVALGLDISNPLQALSGSGGLTMLTLFTYVFVYNIVLALFNLIPAFPLDGGRILRSLLALRLNYVRATSIAVIVGRVFAILMGIYGLMNGGFFLFFIAIFIYAAGSQEGKLVSARDILRGMKVEQVYSDAVYRLNPMSTVQQAGNLMIYGRQRHFPVVDGERLVGFLTYPDLVKARQTAAPHSLVLNLMRRDVVPISCEADLFEAQSEMNGQGLEALPVVNGSRFLGMITAQQIAESYRLISNNPGVMPQGQSA